MSSASQKLVIKKKKNGNSKGIMVRKSSGMVRIQKKPNGSVRITKSAGKFYINGNRFIGSSYRNQGTDIQ